MLEGLGQLKKINDLIGNRTRYLAACSIVPQPTTLPRAPKDQVYSQRVNTLDELKARIAAAITNIT
jgi:hypothetical protein